MMLQLRDELDAEPSSRNPADRLEADPVYRGSVQAHDLPASWELHAQFLRRHGCAALEESDYASTHNASAASYTTYGMPCELKPGCIVVSLGRWRPSCEFLPRHHRRQHLSRSRWQSKPCSRRCGIRKTIYRRDALAGEADGSHIDLAANGRSFANASRQAAGSPRPTRPGHGQIRSDDGASAATRQCRLVFEGSRLGCDGQRPFG